MLEEILRKHLEEPAKKCAVGKWLDEQDPNIKDLFSELMKKQRVLSQVHRDLSALGIPFGITTFKSHMQGTCTCQKQ